MSDKTNLVQLFCSPNWLAEIVIKRQSPWRLFLLSADGEIVSVTGMRSGTDKAHLRTLQATRRSDTSIVSAGLSMLAAKAGNQSSLLKYFSKYRKTNAPDLAERLSKTAAAISGYADSIRRLDLGTAMIRGVAMGLEGKAASIYWQALTVLIPDYLGFTNRKTRGATDVVNQCLNYTYALLYGEVWRKVYGFGLDPCFGIIHSSVRDMGSLVFDVIEEFRVPFTDRLIISLLGRGVKPEVKKDGRLMLRTRKIILSGFLKRWNKKMSWRSKNVSPQEILHLQTGGIVAMFLEDRS